MKYRIVNRRRFIIFTAALLLVLCFALAPLFSVAVAEERAENKCTTVTVKEGDTLWALAKAYGSPKKDVRRVIFEICQINDIRADLLCPGMEIMIPNH